jgi:myo-inositol 2-dehydrogenase / D-chiro-inositol 1-dehydrogenase
VKIGIAGTGRIGVMHARVLAEHPDVEQLVITDIDVARATAVAQEVNGIVAGDVGELLAAELDGFVVAAPTAAHAELVKAASNAGVPVFCEKPVAIDVEQTQEVLDHVTASGVPVHVGFQRRFDEGYAAARQALHEGRLGELRRVHLVSADPAPPPSEYIVTSGGIFRDLHVHDLDILRWVTGREVVEVYATGANRGASFFAEAHDVDECTAILTLDDGTLVTLQGSRYNGNGYDIRMELAGTDATQVVGLADRSPLSSAEPDTAFPAGPPWVLFSDRFRSAYANQLHAFIDVAAGRRESPCTVADALAAFFAAEAADLSLHEQRPVRVEEVVEAGRPRP